MAAMTNLNRPSLVSASGLTEVEIASLWGRPGAQIPEATDDRAASDFEPTWTIDNETERRYREAAERAEEPETQTDGGAAIVAVWGMVAAAVGIIVWVVLR